MSTSPIEAAERSQCRLCAEVEKTRHLFDIFGRDGSKHNLDLKIRKCLPIVVQEDDGMPRWVCIDCINRLDMVAVFVESCMRAHHQFLNVMTNDPSKRVAPGGRSEESEVEAAEEIVVKAEPMIADDVMDVDDLRHHVIMRKDNNPRVTQVFSIQSDASTEQISAVSIKAEPVEVNEDD